ncbi:hypothetical protein FIV34_04085 [Luteibacter pinisoli]|uniref:Uncharacterized protein n=1 Tax=Luteibacter pinisoli TaxID=2589080 RepID=A0A4Y5Z0T3_9GAMM|nr:hypothetical protein [Luteibacter pinisoli]QDE38436.1 hypothetical protein FIV34_04085 [Luteibacter pinisoli]
MEIKAGQHRLLESFTPGTAKGQGQLAALRQRAIFDAENRGGDLSVEIKRKAIFRDFARRLDDVGGKGKFWGLAQDPLEQRELVKAIRNEPTGKPQVDAAGGTIRQVLDEALQNMQDAGIHINRLDDWHTPQPWAWEKIGADREQFVRDALDAIDHDRYIKQDGTPMTAPEIEQLVRKSAETLGTNGANKRATGDGGGFGHTVGSSRNAPRQLFFKDADSYTSMMDKYGSANNVHSMLLHHLNGVARDIAAARSFGRDADTFFPQLLEKAFANDAAAAEGTTPEKRARGLEKLERLKRRTLKEWQAMRQPDHPGPTPGWVKVSQGIRGVAGSTLLGSSVFAAIPDLQMAVGYGRLLGLSRSKILGNVATGLNPGSRKAVSRLGIVVDGLESAANRFGGEELGPTGIKFLNHAVHVLSGLRMWDRGMAHGVSASIMDMLGDHVSKTEYASLDRATADYLAKRGVTDDVWNTWKLAEIDKGESGNHTMLTPDAIYDIPDAKLRPLAEQRTAGINKQFEADAAARDERTQQEIDWVKGRTDKFDALKQKTKDTLDAMKARASVKDGHAQGVLDARAEQVRAQVARAEVHTDIARYLSTADTQIRARDFLEAVQEGADIERSAIKQRTHPDNRSDSVVENFAVTPGVGEKMNRLVQRYGRGVADKAEALGRKQAAAEARIDAAQKSIDLAAKERQGAIDDKSKAFARRLDDHLTALKEFSAQMQQNAGKRRELNDAFQDRYGQEVARETRNLRAEAAQTLIGTALHDVQVGARGGAGGSVADQVGLGLDPSSRGTLFHELMSWILFLKQTPLGIFKTHMFDVPNGLDDWKSAWAYRAKFMAGSAALGALGLELKNIANGQDAEDLATRKGLGKILVASGGLGMYGDFFFGDKGDHQNGALAKLLGPGATMAEDAISIFHNGVSAASGAAGVDPEDGEPTVAPDQFGAQALRFGRNYAAPLTRLWYLKAAFNHMVYNNLMDNLSPGYRDRVERRMAERNQTTWWAPTQDLPSRTPDLYPAFGGP